MSKLKEGKITFGEKENRTLADLDTALETALLAFTDGLFTVFINDEEVKTLDTPLTIEADTVYNLYPTYLLSGRILVGFSLLPPYPLWSLAKLTLESCRKV